ncbi:hypothetical protein L596_025881 [Steinernema carpocapsae]|uniref:Uncharacterized protein n=1 Tax=Steinernema carpocapsae TaxID=34508 RepID=A0A4V5ZYY7_STECR|nr:hypothetical protein L596_025881 [Steinernema carpocapsae]
MYGLKINAQIKSEHGKYISQSRFRRSLQKCKSTLQMPSFLSNALMVKYWHFLMNSLIRATGWLRQQNRCESTLLCVEQGINICGKMR